MEVKTCSFVEASDVFANHRLAWDAFAGAEPDCCWGSNNRTLVLPTIIIDTFNDIDCDGIEDEVASVIKRLESLGQTYIDLEN